MKKYIVLLLALTILCTLVGCFRSEQEQNAHLLSVDVRVTGVESNTLFTVEALSDCSDKINTGDIVSVAADNEETAGILGSYQENNHFKIYFPTITETNKGIYVTCFDIVQYGADGKLSLLTEDELLAILSDMGVTIPTELDAQNIDLKKLISDLEDNPDMPFVVSYSVASEFFEEIREAVKQYNGIVE